jgi:hypothetical protein
MTPSPITTATVLLQAVDSSTGVVLSGATFFINGTQQQSSIQLPINMSYMAQAQCAGYGSASQSFTVTGAGAMSVVISMTAMATGLAIQVQFSPALAGLVWTLDGGSSVATNANGVSQVNGVSPGDHTVNFAGTADFAPAWQSITVGSCRSFTVMLVRTTANGSLPPGLNQQTIYDPNSNPLGALGVAQDTSEDTYDNSAYVGYFTSAQARIYIGNLFIDQMHTLQYALQQNNIPVFGYCSEFADAYARGRSLVQGQLVLNYVHQGYLGAALKQYAKLSRSASASGSPPSTGAVIAGVLGKISDISQQGTSSANQELGGLAQQKLTDLLAGSAPGDIDDAKSAMSATNTPYNPYNNPLYEHMVFDMRIEIGDGPQLTVRLLEDVKLGANEQIFDQSGQVIGESYGFTARRLR